MQPSGVQGTIDGLSYVPNGRNNRVRYEVNWRAGRPEVSKGQAMMRLIECAFNYNIHARRGFHALADLVEASDCHEFSYSRLDEAVRLFQDLADAREARGR